MIEPYSICHGPLLPVRRARSMPCAQRSLTASCGRFKIREAVFMLTSVTILRVILESPEYPPACAVDPSPGRLRMRQPVDAGEPNFFAQTADGNRRTSFCIHLVLRNSEMIEITLLRGLRQRQILLALGAVIYGVRADRGISGLRVNGCQ